MPGDHDDDALKTLARTIERIEELLDAHASGAPALSLVRGAGKP